MAIADTARSQLYYVKEVGWGTFPTAQISEMRYTGGNLKFRIDTAKSNEIRSDRNITDLVQIGAGAEGGVNFELSAACLDGLMDGALNNVWGTNTNIQGTGFIVVAASTLIKRPTGSFVTDGIVAGNIVRVAGFGSAGNTGFFRVGSVTATSLLVTGTGAMTDETLAGTASVHTKAMRNGITPASYSLEQKFGDITQFLSYRGMRVSDFSIDMATGGIVTGVINFMGKNGQRAGTTFGTGTPVAAPTGDVLNAVSNVFGIIEGTAYSSAKVQKLSMRINNTPRGQNAIGVLGNVGIGLGRCEVTGNMTVYFEDGAMYDKFLAGTSSSLSVIAKDIANKGYAFSVPKIKFTDGTIIAGAADQDCMVEMGFQGLLDTATSCTIEIDSFTV